MRKTNEGANTFEHSLNHALEFFSKAGSLFVNKESFYKEEESALSLFQKSWIVDKELTMKLLLWLRDCRLGAGNRSGARECYKWLAENDPEWLITNIGWLPTVGRWDDLRSLFGTKAESAAADLWVAALRDNQILAAKWADRSDTPLRKRMKMSIGDFRRFLANMRKNHIVEYKMCNKKWHEIDYSKVPSVAMARYNRAFGRNDEERFNAYKEALAAGKTKIHASVLFPHDCVRNVRSGDKEIADAQFEALPNFMEKSNERIIVISDTSSSMGVVVAGSIRAVDISQGLALYCSSKLPKDSPFYKKFIAFCSESSFKNWAGMSFSKAVLNRDIFDGAVGATRIDKALNLILDTAQMLRVENDHMPTTLLIVSDMQFHSSYAYGMDGCKSTDTEIEKSLKRWDKAGYTRPKIIYWNTAGYAGSPSTVKNINTGLVSGFSPSILESIFEGDDLTPMSILLRTVSKYTITIPE